MLGYGWAETRTALRQHYPLAAQKQCAECAKGRGKDLEETWWGEGLYEVGKETIDERNSN
jgi:hypothetical protein